MPCDRKFVSELIKNEPKLNLQYSICSKLVRELKKELSDRNLSTEGKRDQLMERLYEAQKKRKIYKKINKRTNK